MKIVCMTCEQPTWSLLRFQVCKKGSLDSAPEISEGQKKQKTPENKNNSKRQNEWADGQKNTGGQT